MFQSYGQLKNLYNKKMKRSKSWRASLSSEGYGNTYVKADMGDSFIIEHHSTPLFKWRIDDSIDVYSNAHSITDVRRLNQLCPIGQFNHKGGYLKMIFERVEYPIFGTIQISTENQPEGRIIKIIDNGIIFNPHTKEGRENYLVHQDGHMPSVMRVKAYKKLFESIEDSVFSLII